MVTNKLTAEEMVIADRLRQMKLSDMAEAYEEQLLNPTPTCQTSRTDFHLS